MACGKTAIQTHTLLAHKQCCMPNIRNEYFSSQKNKKKMLKKLFGPRSYIQGRNS